MTHTARQIGQEPAQVNTARLGFSLDSPELKDFVDALDPVNAVADQAAGFLWRLRSESGDATDAEGTTARRTHRPGPVLQGFGGRLRSLWWGAESSYDRRAAYIHYGPGKCPVPSCCRTISSRFSRPTVTA